jgi:hypothetical protein
MRRLIALLAGLFMAGALLVAAGPASASAYTWQYQMGNIGGQLHPGTTVYQAQNWTVETYDIRPGGSCHRSQLRLQKPDANLVDYYAHSDVGSCSPFVAWWATNKFASSGMTLHFQGSDGHVFLRNAAGVVVWSAPWSPVLVNGYQYIVRLGYGCWDEYRAPPQGGSWTKLWELGPGTCL